MALKSRKLYLFLSILTLAFAVGSASTFGESKLPVLTTKQDIRNIRFISQNGKYTYYQRGNGSLQFSTNYSVKEVLKFSPNTQYTVTKGRASKHIIIQVNELFNDYLSVRSPQKIYVAKYGSNESTYLADGIAINLHIDDQWVSFYDPLKKILVLKNHLNPSLEYEVRLANKINPYFHPEVVMLDEDTVLYTDLNKKGISGILKYSVNAKKVELLFKLNSPLQKIEICENEDQVFWLQYGLDPIQKGSELKSISKAHLLKTPIDLSKTKLLYSSAENDIGDLICDQKNGFVQIIKTYRSPAGKLTYDAAEIELKTGKHAKLSDVNFATSLIQMDKKLLLPYQDKFHVLYGEDNLTKFDKLKDRIIR
jgi:hypothetical protein